MDATAIRVGKRPLALRNGVRTTQKKKLRT